MKCAVVTCNNDSTSNFDFYPFPTSMLCKKWMQACGWKNVNSWNKPEGKALLKKLLVCSDHFKIKDFSSKREPVVVDGTVVLQKKLKCDAIPTLFLSRESKPEWLRKRNRINSRHSKSLKQNRNTKIEDESDDNVSIPEETDIENTEIQSQVNSIYKFCVKIIEDFHEYQTYMIEAEKNLPNIALLYSELDSNSNVSKLKAHMLYPKVHRMWNSFLYFKRLAYDFHFNLQILFERLHYISQVENDIKNKKKNLIDVENIGYKILKIANSIILRDDTLFSGATADKTFNEAIFFHQKARKSISRCKETVIKVNKKIGYINIPISKDNIPGQCEIQETNISSEKKSTKKDLTSTSIALEKPTIIVKPDLTRTPVEQLIQRIKKTSKTTEKSNSDVVQVVQVIPNSNEADTNCCISNKTDKLTTTDALNYKPKTFNSFISTRRPPIVKLLPRDAAPLALVQERKLPTLAPKSISSSSSVSSVNSKNSTSSFHNSPSTLLKSTAIPKEACKPSTSKTSNAKSQTKLPLESKKFRIPGTKQYFSGNAITLIQKYLASGIDYFVIKDGDKRIKLHSSTFYEYIGERPPEICNITPSEKIENYETLIRKSQDYEMEFDTDKPQNSCVSNRIAKLLTNTGAIPDIEHNNLSTLTFDHSEKSMPMDVDDKTFVINIKNEPMNDELMIDSYQLLNVDKIKSEPDTV